MPMMKIFPPSVKMESAPNEKLLDTPLSEPNLSLNYILFLLDLYLVFILFPNEIRGNKPRDAFKVFISLI